MYTRLLNLWSSFRSSFWFLPAVMMCFAALFAFSLIWFDNSYGRTMINSYPIFELSPPAARSILSSIIGAMVSTTGVVFSITIVTLSLASSQFGSRLIRTYRKRRTTQFTLGIFVSTSLFCILVLASIREIDGVEFVPTVAVTIAIVLAVVCLSTLVLYVHFVSRAIQAPNVIQNSSDDLHDAITRLFPENFGDQFQGDQASGESDQTSSPPLEEDLGEFELTICCQRIGYLQAIENETVMKIANENDLVIRLLVRPGDFLFEELALAKVRYPHGSSDKEKKRIEKLVSKSMQKSLIVGPGRTHLQDIRHAFEEIVDIAVRALSPGVNDPFTAVHCVDQTHAALLKLQGRRIPDAYRLNEDGVLRVIVKPVKLEECIEGSLGVISDYANDNPMVVTRIASAMASIRSKQSQ